MAVRFTVGQFPRTPALRDSCGLPWACVVQPFNLDDSSSLQSAAPLPRADDIARCEECFAYINAYCTLERYSWRCSLCEAVNSFADQHYKRYGNKTRVMELPEIASTVVQLDVAMEEEEEETSEPLGSKYDFYKRPVYVAAVDLASSEEVLELVKSALLAALEALHPSALFGLLTFGHKVGLYDVQGSIPVVKYVTIPAGKDATLPMELEDVMSLESFLAPVDKHKDHITAALETLRPANQSETSSVTPDVGENGQEPLQGGGKRGFGVALDAVLRYFGAEGGSRFVSARLFSFISGPPNFGIGKLDVSRYKAQSSENDSDPASLLVEQTSFYKDMAAVAVQAGLCVDLFVVSSEYVDLASLKFLSVESGGSLFLYSSAEEATLPQDIYRMLSRPHALGGLLRLRCSPDFRLVRAYGHFFPDVQYENLYHIISCDSFDTYAFDFEFNGNQGFNRQSGSLPVLQLAFQYTVLVPAEREENGQEGQVGLEFSKLHLSEAEDAAATSNGTQNAEREYVLRRRMVIRTVQVPVTRSVEEIYESADTEAILTVLAHKVILASVTESVAEGRLLLQAWLVILTAQYNHHFRLAQFSAPHSAPLLDAAFTRCSALQPIPRLAFALLRSALLRSGRETVHPDTRIYVQCLYSSLDPACLLRAVYPVLSSYSTPDKLAFPRHSLSRAALITSGSPIFLLDAFTVLIVYYSPAAPSYLPFPPPHNTLLRNTINRLKQDRNITPRLLMIRGGYDNTEPFERFLIEEQDVDGQAAGQGAGFVSFLEQVIANDAREYMK